MTIDARTILKLLEQRHTHDVFVAECKDGPTWGGNHLRMDAWAMRRSWTRPLARAYEIKVTRSDFLGDKKWPGYLDCCNEFYFVAPPGIIDPAELGNEVGLLCVSRTGTKLYTKKRAAYREVEIPECLYQYILMSRAQIMTAREARHAVCREDQGRDYWRKWLKLQEEDAEIGRAVARRLRRRHEQDVEEVQRKQAELERKIGVYETMADMCRELGVNPHDWNARNYARRRLQQLLAAVPEDLRLEVNTAHDALDRLKTTLDRIEAEANEVEADEK